MQTLELLRRVSAAGLTDMFLARLIQRVEEIQDANPRGDREFGALMMLPGEIFPAQLAG